ncbi:MAG: DMSO reductase [Alphaproteobacteria bacterium]|nr:DMSO reductase [Alphaproteobacteria bacterium]
MHPAYSVIFFTTASSTGYGALIWLVILAGTGATTPTFAFGAVTFVIALGLITAGLLSSTFHLGHPERAWRALSQWRSSWLSREGVAAVVTYVPALVFAAGWLLLGTVEGIWLWVGILAAILSAATVACTGMIYASLRAIPRWSNPLVVPLYLGFSLSSGAILMVTLAAIFGMTPGIWAWIAAAATALTWAMKKAYWRHIDTAAPTATAESATGLGEIGKVRLLESPNSSANYIMREMGYGIARKHAARLRTISMVTGALVPIVALVLAGFLGGMPALAAVVLALLGTAIGVLVERWLFFAEAQHSAMLYYGASDV